MRRWLLFILIAEFVALAVVFWPELTSTASDLQPTMTRHGLTAANVAFGRADAEPRIIAINAPEGLVRPFYSLSKPITAAAAIQVLSLERKIEGATVRQILQHSGGWDRAIAGDPVTQRSDGEECTSLPAPNKQFEPGSRYAYSNIGYCLVGHAIASASGKTYQDAVNGLFPETQAMRFDPWLGPAGGWSGTARDYFRFASRQIPAGTGDNPIPRSDDIPYGLGWAIGPDFYTHFGVMNANFSLVVKQGDFVAVGIFDGRPKDDAKAARELRSALLRLR
jgi:hypothetical protein